MPEQTRDVHPRPSIPSRDLPIQPLPWKRPVTFIHGRERLDALPIVGAQPVYLYGLRLSDQLWAARVARAIRRCQVM